MVPTSVSFVPASHQHRLEDDAQQARHAPRPESMPLQTSTRDLVFILLAHWHAIVGIVVTGLATTCSGSS
jgi:hypothetical protein